MCACERARVSGLLCRGEREQYSQQQSVKSSSSLEASTLMRRHFLNTKRHDDTKDWMLKRSKPEVLPSSIHLHVLYKHLAVQYKANPSVKFHCRSTQSPTVRKKELTFLPVYLHI